MRGLEVTRLYLSLQEPHYTTQSHAVDGEGRPVAADISPITRYGSSFQISESLVQRIKILEKKKADLPEESWEEYYQEITKTYEDELSTKMQKVENVAGPSLLHSGSSKLVRHKELREAQAKLPPFLMNDKIWPAFRGNSNIQVTQHH